MKKAQVILLSVAVAAGGAAFMLMNVPNAPPPPPSMVPAPASVALDEVLVASHDLPYGALVKEADMEWRAWPKDAVPEGALRKSQSPAAKEELASSRVRVPITAGDPLRRDRLVKGALAGLMASLIAPGKRAVAIDVTPNATAGGFILPNDRVDVFTTFRDQEVANVRGGDVLSSELVVGDVRVLAIGQTADAKSGEAVAAGATATLELDPRQAEAVIVAQRSGQLFLALRPAGDAKEAARDHESGVVTVVRSGAASVQRVR